MLARVVLAFAAVTLATAAGPVGPAGLPTLRSTRAGAPFARSHLRSSKTDADEPTYNDPDAYTGGQAQGQQKTMSCQSLRANLGLRGGAGNVPEEVVQSGPKLQLVFVSAEIAPWSVTGGLGAVCDGLPRALAKLGHRVMTIAPRYDQYYDAWDTEFEAE
ncbi:starch synthase catalytic domain-containing protein, partial [Baffinella frigidus]